MRTAEDDITADFPTSAFAVARNHQRELVQKARINKAMAQEAERARAQERQDSIDLHKRIDIEVAMAEISARCGYEPPKEMQEFLTQLFVKLLP